uniref:Uncharacterized protein n=1 Tax=Oryza brachyantha TaxID=4533 RepID=J3M0F1_ORYBR
RTRHSPLHLDHCHSSLFLLPQNPKFQIETKNKSIPDRSISPPISSNPNAVREREVLKVGDVAGAVLPR